jgi:hypothetical protein
MSALLLVSCCCSNLNVKTEATKEKKLKYVEEIVRVPE